MRIDKWLWAARFFKTRALASKACGLGRIEGNGSSLKPAKEIKVGDVLKIRTEANTFEVEVLILSEMRGPSAVALTLYRETESSRQLREAIAQERKLLRQMEPPREGRPTKRDRRKIIQFRSGTD